MNLKFDEAPKYDAYIRLFEGLCGPRPTRPIQTQTPPTKVGQKRQRDPNDEIFLDSTGAPKKKVRDLVQYCTASMSSMCAPVVGCTPGLDQMPSYFQCRSLPQPIGQCYHRPGSGLIGCRGM